MTDAQVTFITINLVMGLLFIVLGVPLAKRKIPMNYWYGFRLPNAYGGRQMVIWSVPVLVTAVACFFIPVRDDTHPMVIVFFGGGSLTLFVAIAIVNTLIYSSKLAK
jgi:hypothetical protein